jgi:ATP-dependent Clp protease ATP-binding subunit ClpC
MPENTEKPEIIPNFTPQAQIVIKSANRIALAFGDKQVSVLHLFFGLFTVKSSTIASFIDRLGVDPIHLTETLQDKVDELSIVQSGELTILPQSKCLMDAVSDGDKCSEMYKCGYIDAIHLMYGVCLSSSITIDKEFEDVGIDRDIAIEVIQKIFIEESVIENPNSKHYSSDITLGVDNEDYEEKESLEDFTENYTIKALSGDCDHLICTQEELDELYETLCSKDARNAIIVSESDTHRESIMQGFAKQSMEGKIPYVLSGSSIHRLDLGALFSNIHQEGQFEHIWNGLISSISSENSVIFVAYNIGDLLSHNSMMPIGFDPLSVLLNTLQDQNLMCVFEATSSESWSLPSRYHIIRKYYKQIVLEDSKIEDVKAIIENIVKDYAEHHGVIYRKNLVQYTFDLIEQYSSSKASLDNCTRILDKAGSRARIRGRKKPDNLIDLEKALYKEAATNADIEANSYIAKFKAYTQALEEWAKQISETQIYVRKEDIKSATCKILHIPEEKLKPHNIKIVHSLEKQLKKKIIGQDEALNKVCQAVTRSFAGVSEPNQPIGSFFFAGESGVGKTYISKILALELFGGEEKFIRLDMSEFQEKHTISKLLGAPAGYIGYEDGGTLTTLISKNPKSVVLFDEMEKAHPDVWNLLLQILEEGKLTDGQGKVVDFSDAIIIISSNNGSQYASKNPVVGFATDIRDSYEEKVINAIKQDFKPEILNRFNDIVVFNSLTRIEMKEILKLEFNKIQERVKDKLVKIKYNDKFESLILDEVDKINKGARGVKGLLKRHVELPLATKILSKKPKTKLNFVFSELAS